MTSLKNKIEIVVNMPTNGTYSAVVIFLHGTGGTGETMRDGIRDKIGLDFSFPHIKVIFPTAPLMPYTLRGGEPGNVWFDRATLEPNGVEYLNSIDKMAHELSYLIQAEVNAGIPKKRIVLVGFSMGATMALHLGLRFERELAGIVSLSTFLYRDSEVYKMLRREKNSYPPVFYCHGDKDALVDHAWGLETKEQLQKLGIKDITFHTIPGLKHTVNKQVLTLVKSWVLEILPMNQ